MGKKKKEQRPLRALQIEVTSRCTRQCVICPRSVNGPAWRVVELREIEGPSALFAGGPPGLDVARWWPGNLPALPPALATWQSFGIPSVIKPEGHCDWGTGHGDYYHPERGETGASWIWAKSPSECVQGLGMLGGTNHRSLKPTFAWIEGEPEPEPEPDPDPEPEPGPTPEDIEAAKAECHTIIAAAEAALVYLGEG